MITNREEVIDKAFKVFLRMNYEKASISTLAKACGVVKTGVVYYFPHKLDLFMAVADKYAIQIKTPANKFAGPRKHWQIYRAVCGRGEYGHEPYHQTGAMLCGRQ